MENINSIFTKFGVVFCFIFLAACSGGQSSEIASLTSKASLDDDDSAMAVDQCEEATGGDLLLLNGAELKMSGKSQVHGSVVSIEDSKGHLSGQATINGDLMAASGYSLKTSGQAGVLGMEVEGDFSSWQIDVEMKSQQLAALPATHEIIHLKDSMVITAQPGLNVINIGKLHLTGQDVLTLKGSASDQFVLNIEGCIKLSGQAAIIGDGVGINQIIVNSIDAEEVHLSGQSIIAGNLIAIRSGIHLSGQSHIRGSATAGGKRAHLSGQSSIGAGGLYCPMPEPDEDDGEGNDSDEGTDNSDDGETQGPIDDNNDQPNLDDF